MANDSKQQDEFEEKVLFINRCSKVVTGGRRFSFSALVAVGNRNGLVGFGFAKANELTDAIRKAGEQARKYVRPFERLGDTIPHEVVGKVAGAEVMLRPARPGTGVVAGSQTRIVLQLAGVKDVVAKNLRNNNPINQVRATMQALSLLCNQEEYRKRRGIG